MHLTANLEGNKERATEHTCRETDARTLDELYDVFWAGRRQYGGEFDAEVIACVRE